MESLCLQFSSGNTPHNPYLSIFHEGTLHPFALIIIGTEWDDESSVEKNSFRISQFQGMIFVSDYQCFKVERDKDIMVAKITNRTEYSILELLKKDVFLFLILFYTLLIMLNLSKSSYLNNICVEMN